MSLLHTTHTQHIPAPTRGEEQRPPVTRAGTKGDEGLLSVSRLAKAVPKSSPTQDLCQQSDPLGGAGHLVV